MFTVLVARPGIGKGAAMVPAEGLLKEANTSNILSDRLTMPFVLEQLAKGFPSQFSAVPGSGAINIGTETAAMLYAPELSVFIRQPEEYLPDLANLWDSREGDISYGTRGKGEYKIKSPCVSMLAGSAPNWLVKSIPANAVGGGFTRRVNFVYAKSKEQYIPWPNGKGYSGNRTALIDDLRHISSNIRGEMTFAQDARPVFESCYNSALPAEFDDEATSVFKTSKWAHATKLAMVLSASESDTLVITKKNFEDALVRIDEVIEDISMVFRAIGESELVEVADKVLQYIELKGFVSTHDMLHALWRHVTYDDLNAILATLEHGGMIRQRVQGHNILYYAVKQP